MTTFLLFALAIVLAILGAIFGAFESIGRGTRDAARSVLFNYGPGVVLPKSRPSRAHYYILGLAAICIITAVVRLFL